MKNYARADFVPYGKERIKPVKQPFNVRIAVNVHPFTAQNGRKICAAGTEKRGAVMVVVDVRYQNIFDFAEA
jgi:hypothetical protein